LISTEAAPVNHPTIDLGCGSFCMVNYDSVISSVIAIVVTIVVAIIIARSLQPDRPGRLQALAEWLFSYVRRTATENAPDAPYLVPLAATIEEATKAVVGQLMRLAPPSSATTLGRSVAVISTFIECSSTPPNNTQRVSIRRGARSARQPASVVASRMTNLF